MPQYIDVAIERWQAFTGEEAHLEANRGTFADIRSERQADREAETDGKARSQA